MLRVSLSRPAVPVQRYQDYTLTVPIDIQCSNEYSRLIGLVISKVATELSDKAYTNKARMYVYNLAVEMNYVNVTFRDLVQFVIDVASLWLSKGMSTGYNNSIEDSLSESVTIYTAYLAYNDREVYDRLAPELQEGVRQNANKYNKIMEDIMRYTPRHNPQQQPMNYQQPQQPMNYQQPQQYMSPPYQQPMQQGGYPQLQQQQPMSHVGYQSQLPPSSQGNVMDDKYAMQAPAVPNSATPPPIPTTSQPQKLYQAPGSEYVPVVKKGYLVNKQLDGNVVSYNVIKDEKCMDRSLHSMTVNNTDLDTRYRVSGKESELADVIYAKESNNRTTTGKDIPLKDALSKYIREECLYAATLSSLLVDTNLHYMCKKGELSVTQYKGNVVTPFFIEGHTSTRIFAASKKYRGLPDYHKWLVTVMRDDLSLSKEDPFYKHIDTTLTRYVNSFLRDSLGLDVAIESFITDWSDLGEFLLEEEGVSIHDKFSKWSKRYTSNSVSRDKIESIWANLFDLDGLVEGHLDTLMVSYRISYIGLYEEELALANIDESAKQILESTSPILYQMAYLALDTDDDFTSTINLLITSDNIIYEVCKGALNTEAILIKRYTE